MAGFELDARFDAVVCPYDSINHLLDFSDWNRTFRSVRDHLNAKGAFIFDINTEFQLRSLARSPPWVHRFGDNVLVMSVSTSPRGVADWDISVFEAHKRNLYRLHREVIKERSFPHRRIKGALSKLFQTVRAFDGPIWSRPTAESRRVFYVCTKA